MEVLDVEINAFLTQILDRSEWSASRPGLFNPTKKAPGIHSTGVSVGPREAVDITELNKT
jgi:hypothetical protein